MWRPILNALDPWRELATEELEACYEPRPDRAPSQLLAYRLLDEPLHARHKLLVCGARGSGKSTELTRLLTLLCEEYVVVKLDAGAGLPQQAATPALLTLLGAAVLRTGQHWLNPDADIADLERTFKGKPLAQAASAFTAALKGMGVVADVTAQILKAVSPLVELTVPGAKAPLAVGAAAASAGHTALAGLRTGDRLRLLLNRDAFTHTGAARPADTLQALTDALNLGLAALSEAAGRPPLLVAEGLDKLETLDAVKAALAEVELITQLNAPLVLSGPIQLRHHLEARRHTGGLQVEAIHNVAVRQRDGAVNPDGVAWLGRVYARRLRALGAVPDEVFAPEAVTLAAEQCAGLLRDFLQLLHRAAERVAMAGGSKVELHHMEASVRGLRLEKQGYLDAGHLATLKRVLDDGLLPMTDAADTLLFDNFLVCYANGDLWYRPHETLVDYLRKLPTP